MAITYKDSGVDIKAGEDMVQQIKADVATTYNADVLSGIGLFGGFYRVPEGYKKPVLVSSVDGVGTKLKIAFLMDIHDTIGEDLVNHCVNDIAVCGAKPLYFLDYLGTGKLEPAVGAQIVQGMARGCRNNQCALIGGETAEMPGFYQAGEYDVSGTIVGVVEEDKIINGSLVDKGMVMLALPSNGLHTNGYSLARKVLLEKYKVTDKFSDLEGTLGEELLKVHKSYLPQITLLQENLSVKGMSHITGGGLEGNTRRILKPGLTLAVDYQAWEWPAIFKIIQREGQVPLEDMRQALNLGIGIVFVLDKNDVNKAVNLLSAAGEKPILIGEIR